MTTSAYVSKVDESNVALVLPMAREYCAFYDAAPSEEALLAVFGSLVADPGHGVQLLATLESRPVGFATVYWSWSTLAAARIGVLNDLYVDARFRGQGVGTALMHAARNACVDRGDIHSLRWQTAKDNAPARALYDKTGAARSEWVDYSLRVSSP